MIYCTKCGRGNSEDAVYCQKCGSMLEVEEQTRVVRRPGHAEPEGEKEIFSISPTLIFVASGYVLAILASLLLVVLISIFLPGISPWLGVALGLALLLVPVFYHVRQKLVRYRLTDSNVVIDKGLISRTTQNIPLARIQDVTVSATIFQRVLGFGNIVIDNASEDGGKIFLKNINSPRKYAGLLLKQMNLLQGPMRRGD